MTPNPRQLVRILRDLVRRFGELENQIAGLTDDLGTARVETADLVRVESGRVREAVTSAGRAHADELEELRGIAGLTARRTGLRRTRTRVVFLVHQVESWDSYHDLVAAMRRAPDFDPVVVSCPRHFHGDPGFVGEGRVHAGLTARDVPHLRLAATGEGEALRLVRGLDPDIVFRQSQWDADVLRELGTDHLGFARLCLVPYETANLVVNADPEGSPNSAVDSRFHRAAWLVFCASDTVRDAAVRDGALAGAQFVVTGHPKVERLRATAPRWPIARPTSDPRAPRVLWVAHHSIGRGWNDFGMFPAVAETMLQWARERPGTDFVLVPHPALVSYTAAPESPYSAAQMASWRQRWTLLPNTAVVDDGDYAPLLQATDVTVSDGLSSLVEQQVVGRPVVFLEREGHRPFNAAGALARRGVHAVRSAAQAREVATPFLDGEPDPLREEQKRTVAELFGEPGSVQRIMDVLRSEIAAELGRPAPHDDHRPSLGSLH